MSKEDIQIKQKHIGIVVIVLLVIIGIGFFVFNFSGKQTIENSVQQSTINNENLRIAEIDLPGMFCQGCVAGAKNMIEGLDGVIEANVTLKPKMGVVIYDSEAIKAEEIVNAVQIYDAELLSDKKYKTGE